MSREETVVQQRGALATTAYVVNILMGIAFTVAVIMIAGLNMGWISSAPIAEPTVRTLPTTPPDPAPQRPQPVQAVATGIPALPTPLPVGQPAVQVQPVAPVEGGAPAPVSSDAPATIKARGPICFAGLWYIDGQNTGISCSGTGGD
jgi:hypothetical protein